MKRFFFPWSFLLAFLLFFACAKDQDLADMPRIDSVELTDENEAIQARKKCKDCLTPHDAFIEDVGLRTALFRWEYENGEPSCGKYSVRLEDLSNGGYTIFYPVSNPMVFTDLLPCTEYRASVSHVSDLCSSLPLSRTFTTECYCESSSLNPSFLYIDHLILPPNHIALNSPPLPYQNQTQSAMYMAPNQQQIIGLGIRTDDTWPGPIFIKLWIDLDQNGIFDTPELISVSTRNISGIGVPNGLSVALDPFIFPNVLACDLTARLVVSPNENALPCGILPMGHVVDFTINSGDVCD